MIVKPAKLVCVEDELGRKFSQPFRTELESFESGAELLRVYFANSYFVIAFDGKGFWVDEPKAEDGFTSSFRYQFSDLSSASEGLIRMMSSALPRYDANDPQPVTAQAAFPASANSNSTQEPAGA